MSNSMGKVIHQRLKRALTVGIFSAQAAVLEHHLSIIDIIAQAPPAYDKSVLTFAHPDTRVSVCDADDSSCRNRC